ncbi:MAG TPA: hypothetical protein VGQ65_23630 [Thermoanaerobaculia bacterium]|jgi:hypothetical protein|nr:hypothetical protein [Thermoanaerobaculia bacterium]
MKNDKNTTPVRSEQSGGYISIDPREAIDRNQVVITQIRKLVERHTQQSRPATVKQHG